MNAEPNPAPTPRTDAERHKTHACYDAVTADFARTLERELASAQAALAAAKEDMERLDWLEKTPGSCYASVEPDGDILMHFVAVPEAPAKDRRGYVKPTARAAIDAARKAQP